MNLTSENPVSIDVGRKIQFTYSVNWVESSKPFQSRFDRYLEYDFFEHRIHWFSVFNSFMMVIFLCGLVALILLRTLRNDFAKYAKDEDVDVEGLQVIGEDTGWKQIHGDVFRAPEQLVVFSALIGSGWQLATLVLGVILYAIAGMLFYFFRMPPYLIVLAIFQGRICMVICMKTEEKWFLRSSFVLHYLLSSLVTPQAHIIDNISQIQGQILALNGKRL